MEPLHVVQALFSMRSARGATIRMRGRLSYPLAHAASVPGGPTGSLLCCWVSTMKSICILWMSLILALGAAAAQNMSERQASISGRVLDVSGSPYPAEVLVFQIVIRDGFAQLDLKCERNTNQEGVFTCAKLSEGKFIVQVLPKSRLGQQTRKAQDITAGLIPKSLFYSNVTDLEQ